MKNRFAHSIFCDDIRPESGNKHSYIGVYGLDLFVEQVPSSLAQFCVLTTFNTDIADPVKSLKVIINIGGQLAREIELPAAYLEAAHQVFVDAASKGEKQGMSFYRIQAGITPLTIENPAALEVFAIADGVEYPAGQLQIKLSSAA